MTDKKRINIAIDPDLHKQLRVMTVENDTTITDYVVEAIAEKLEREKANKEG